MVEQSVGRVQNRKRLQILQLNQSTFAASEAAKEEVWIKKFNTELGVVPSIVHPILLYCDNNGAIAQAKEPQSHQRSKNVLRRYHLIREIIGRNDVKIEKIPTDLEY